MPITWILCVESVESYISQFLRSLKVTWLREVLSLLSLLSLMVSRPSQLMSRPQARSGTKVWNRKKKIWNCKKDLKAKKRFESQTIWFEPVKKIRSESENTKSETEKIRYQLSKYIWKWKMKISNLFKRIPELNQIFIQSEKTFNTFIFYLNSLLYFSRVQDQNLNFRFQILFCQL